MSNGSDIDSEGYSIRPELPEIDRKNQSNRNDDMNNLYASSSTDSDSDDSDSENNGSISGPIKVMLKINPKSDIENNSVANNADVLRQISKNLQLKPLQPSVVAQTANGLNKNSKKRTYYYNYGTANPDQNEYSSSSFLHQTSQDITGKEEKSGNLTRNSVSMTRSCSMGSVINSDNFITNSSSINSGKNLQAPSKQISSVINSSESLFDFGKLILECNNALSYSLNLVTEYVF